MRKPKKLWIIRTPLCPTTKNAYQRGTSYIKKSDHKKGVNGIDYGQVFFKKADAEMMARWIYGDVMGKCCEIEALEFNKEESK